MFTNEQIEIGTLPSFETVKMQAISKKYLNIIIINKLGIFIVLYAALFVVNVYASDIIFTEYFWYLFFSLSLLFILNLIFAVLAFKKRKYAIREKDVLYSKGLLVHKLIVVPISRIQHIEETKTWLARQFNLASIKIFTAGDAGTDLSINGLTNEEAKRINDFLSARVNADH